MRLHAAVATTALVVLVAAGCTGGDEPRTEPSPTAAQPSATASQDMSVEDFAASILHSEEVGDEEAGFDDPLATLTVPVAASTTSTYDVEVAVVALSASTVGTDLVLSMRTADGGEQQRSENYSWGTSTRSDLRAIELRPDPESVLKPYTVMSQPDIEQDALCACSEFPKEVTGASMVRTALFPPLPSGTSEVAVAFPGAEPVTVPVTWE